MKTESSNLWPLIRWMTAAVLFALTIGIAVDQVNTKDRDLKALQTKFDVMSKDLYATRIRLDKAQKEKSELLQTSMAQAESTLDLIEAHQRVQAAQKLVDETRAKREQSESALAAVSTRQQPVTTRSATVPVIPAWYPPASSVVTKAIRDNALAEYKDNFASANYEIERQTEAYEKILRYYKTADPGIKALINKAALEYGSNYSSFAYEVERQLEASQKLKAR